MMTNIPLNDKALEVAATAAFESRPSYTGSGKDAHQWRWSMIGEDPKTYWRDAMRLAITAYFTTLEAEGMAERCESFSWSDEGEHVTVHEQDEGGFDTLIIRLEDKS